MKPQLSRTLISILSFVYSEIGSRNLSSKSQEHGILSSIGHLFHLDFQLVCVGWLIIWILTPGKLIVIVNSWKLRKSWIIVSWLVYTSVMTIIMTKWDCHHFFCVLVSKHSVNFKRIAIFMFL